MRKIFAAMMLAASTSSLVACGSGGSLSALPSYAQKNIEAAISEKNCDSLQKYFDDADNLNAVNAMEYINNAMKKVGCVK